MDTSALSAATFKAFTNDLIGIGNGIVIPMIITLAFAVFIYGVFKYFILHGEDEESRKHGRAFAIWGLLGMVVIFSIWGFVNLLLDTLGFVGS
ncbi:MAG TPA: hypothetical protein VM103_01705 [Candidatus Paceibacterota bacterium]|nr:hypothetical protein [Candidatus Paceibacterota bacterium]